VSATTELAVGIDLGTTHTVVAYASIGGSEPARVFPIPQWTNRTEWQALPLLASALYRPLPGEMSHGESWIVGEYAKRRGVETEGRVVLSAKSWLSHGGVDRTAPILPWGVSSADSDFERISPLDASARVLAHVRATWNEVHPEAPLERQRIVLTVPASFDATARELTVRAAERAGLGVRLLEEPQAAFYAWLDTQTDEGLSALVESQGGTLDALVLDVGGGTTDFSLLRLERGDGAVPSVDRIAVGRHLLLGGDNMDLALAHACEAEMTGSSAAHLDAHHFGQLVLACRAAKERLLGPHPPELAPVVVSRKGKDLVGGTMRATLSRSDVERMVLEGFFPPMSRPVGALVDRARSGLVAFGLPYERDVAITRHLARFCERHLVTDRGPGAVLLNGGVFLSERLAARAVDVVSAWNEGRSFRLSSAHPEEAVALGAVSFARAVEGRGRRIRGGLGRGYYVGVEGADRKRSLVCVVPRGAEEGERHVAASAPVALLVGRPARFELFASEHPLAHAAGDVVPYDEEKFESLPPLAVRFDDVRDASGAKPSGAAAGRPNPLRVALEGEISPVGTLDLACVAIDPDARGERARFRLAFQIRPSEAPRPASPESGEPSRSRSTGPPRAGSRRMEEAAVGIERIFGKGTTDVAPRQVKDLHRELERLLGDRSAWTAEVNRALFDELWRHHRGRRRSADHERVFWQLAGFSLRPGVGDPDDTNRVAAIFALFADKLTFADEPRSWQAFWIAWRRVAAGLDPEAQTALRDAIDPFFAPAALRRKRPKAIRPEALDEMLEMAASLERVAPERRAELGDWIVERTWTRRDARLWVAVGKLGARAPTYASAHHVVAPAVVEPWLDHLLREKWDELPSAAEAAVHLARMTGDRARDIREALRREVERRLVRGGAREDWIKALREVVPLAEKDRAAFFGEGLPVGLRLLETP
jgi:hypothetical protein